MSEFWKTVLYSSGLSAGVLSILQICISTWIKKSIETKYDKDLADHKSRLRGELEGTKAGYKETLDKHQIRFSHLHAERAHVLKELYSKLVEMERKTGAVTLILFKPANNNTEEQEEKIKQKEWTSAANSINDLHECFRKHRIFLKEEECAQIEDLHTLACKAFNAIQCNDLYNEGEEKRKNRHKAHTDMGDCFPKLRKTLEEKFRIAMGLIDNSQSATETEQ